MIQEDEDIGYKKQKKIGVYKDDMKISEWQLFKRPKNKLKPRSQEAS